MIPTVEELRKEGTIYQGDNRFRIVTAGNAKNYNGSPSGWPADDTREAIEQYNGRIYTNHWI